MPKMNVLQTLIFKIFLQHQSEIFRIYERDCFHANDAILHLGAYMKIFQRVILIFACNYG